MSRTRKTNPWWVKAKDDRLAYDHLSFPGHVVRWPKWWIGESRCGCSMCTNKHDRKIDRRKERYAGKETIREEQMKSGVFLGCPCDCHKDNDHCVICTNDYSDLCDGSN